MPQMAVTQSSLLCHRLVDQLTLQTCTVLAAAPMVTSAMLSYAPGLRGGAGHRVGAVVDVEEGVGAGRVGRGQAEPALGGELPLP